MHKAQRISDVLNDLAMEHRVARKREKQNNDYIQWSRGALTKCVTSPQVEEMLAELSIEKADERSVAKKFSCLEERLETFDDYKQDLATVSQTLKHIEPALRYRAAERHPGKSEYEWLNQMNYVML